MIELLILGFLLITSIMSTGAFLYFRAMCRILAEYEEKCAKRDPWTAAAQSLNKEYLQ